MTVIPNQQWGIGDIIFEQTIMQEFVKDGFKVLWPVEAQFVTGLNIAYPSVTFVDKALMKIDYNRRDKYKIGEATVLPLRHADSICGVPYHDCMKSKYMLFDMDWQDWRKEAMWQRNVMKEVSLFDTLGIAEGEPYNLINRNFTTALGKQVQIKVDNGYRNIEMSAIKSYSLFDWTAVIMGAKEVHTVSTSLLYMLEILDLKQPLHLYVRKPDEQDFRNVEYLFTKPYNLHL